ncbi:MAG: type II toxin-antitoxin system Phd/YefM family antitoxin [Candidatus Eremiobacteraeota bacterium]|nr:type II toxin-antitoxin system Phd/YefM family antitoxin [Candidatus Eremiobacteraeota bacterium]MBC5803135.1 type II toxin-antitoxin system Phd/YefM family antitoxin [Candidatus Eremiobacteraeota bacterium]MBC5824586.1 type II toxin-antitoxin system Phd/YefM family antitoxin [Candidatus Eremiobacteraeota bacterium]
MRSPSGTHATKTIPASRFKATCLELMDRVQRERVTVTITKRGKPVARLVPPDDELAPLFGSGPVTILGDIIEPIDEQWESQR